MEIGRHAMHERRIALVQHYLDRLRQLSEMHEQAGESAQEALRSLDQEWQQLQAQQQWTAAMALKDSRAASLIGLFPDTAKTLLMQVDTSVAMQWVNDGLMWASDMTMRFRLALRGYLLCERLMNMERGGEMLDEAQRIADVLDDDHLRIEAISLKVKYYSMAEDGHNQLRSAEEMLTIALRLEDQEQIAKAYHRVGVACWWVDQYIRAEGYLKTSKMLFEQLDMRMNEGILFNALAMNAHSWGKHEQVLPYGEAALAIVREFGRREWELVILSNLAFFLTDMGNLEKGLYYAQQGYTASIEAESRVSEYTALTALMLGCAKLGLAEDTHRYLERAQALQRESPRQELQENMEWAGWLLAHERCEWKIACEHAENMAAVAGNRGCVPVENNAVVGWGNSLLELGQLNAAAAAYSRALALRDETSDNPRECANALAGLSYLEACCRRATEAQSFFDRFFALMCEYSLVKFECPFIVAWNAYRAAAALGDSRLPVVVEQIEALFDTYMGYFEDEGLRASFLDQYSQRSLLGVLANR